MEAEDESGKAGFSLPCAGWRANGNLGSFDGILRSAGIFLHGFETGFFRSEGGPQGCRCALTENFGPIPVGSGAG